MIVADPQVKPSTLSDAILIGAQLTGECRGHFFSRGRTCAIGAALTGATGSYAAALGYRTGAGGTVAAVARLLDVDIEIVREAGDEFEVTSKSREEIAAYIKAKGY